MAFVRELVGDDPAKQRLLDVYDRGVYASLIATQAAAGNRPVLANGYTEKELQAQLLPLSADTAMPLCDIIQDFVKAKTE